MPGCCVIDAVRDDTYDDDVAALALRRLSPPERT